MVRSTQLSDKLIGFIEELRRNRYNIGADQCIAAHNLLLQLAAQGLLPDDPQGLSKYLSPVLCTSPEEQDAFSEHFGRWLKRGTEGSDTRGSRAASIRRYAGKFSSRYLLSIVSLLAITFGVYLFKNMVGFGKAPDRGGGGDQQFDPALGILMFLYIAGLILLLVVIRWVLELYRRRALLKKLRTTELPHIRRIIVGEASENPYQSRDFYHTIQQLRHHQSIFVEDLNVPETVTATAMKAGWFTPIYNSRKQTPEYLMLIDRAGFRDQHARLADELFTQLRKAGVAVYRYYFSGGSHICQREKPASPHVTVEELARLHADHYLIVFSDGAGFVPPLTVGSYNQLGSFSIWKNRVVMTSVLRADWGHKERAISDLGFTLTPATKAGIAILVSAIRAGTFPEFPSEGLRRAFPSLLRRRTDRWLSESPPDPATINKLCFQLRLFLGSAGYYWLSACAVYPSLIWELTLYLGSRLIKQEVEFERSLLSLVRLPWFRHGSMPDWLRLWLVSSLPPDQERAIRNLLHSMLESPKGGFTLDIARDRDSERQFFITETESPLRDYVFLAFMLEEKLDRTAVIVPESIHGLLYSREESIWDSHVSRLLVRVCFLLNAFCGLGLIAILWLSTDPFEFIADSLIVTLGATFNGAILFRLSDWEIKQPGFIKKMTLTGGRLIHWVLGSASKHPSKELERPLITVEDLDAESSQWGPELGDEISRQTDFDESGIGGQPKGLGTLFLTEMWERFSYYGFRALLILFMVAPVEAGGLGFTMARAAGIYGIFTGSVYLVSVPGGWVADNILGARRAVLWGGIIIALGHFSTAIPSLVSFYAGMMLIVLGTGLLKPNISAMVGSLYGQDDARRDSGFSIFYIGINLGAVLAPLVCGFLAQDRGFKATLLNLGFDPERSWYWGFAAAGVGMTFGLIQYLRQQRQFIGIGARPPKAKRRRVARVDQSLTANEIKRLLAVGILFVFSVMFWMAFEQAGSSLNLFAHDLTRTSIFNFSFPSTWLQSVNSLFIIALAPVFSWLWIKLGRLQPSSPAKFSYGLLFLGLGFLVIMYASIRAGAGAVSPMWLIVVYLLHTVGELCLSPVGLSTVTKLAPARMVGLMMGVWFLSISVGNFFAGLIAGLASESTMVTLFGYLAAGTIGAAIVLALITPLIQRLISGTLATDGNRAAKSKRVSRV